MMTPVHADLTANTSEITEHSEGASDALAINVSTAYVAADGQVYYQELSLPAGSTVMDALNATSWLCEAPPCLVAFNTWRAMHQTKDTNHRAWYVGVFSQKVRLDTPLHEGDRVEIYRPLALDPMGKRRTKLKKPKAGRQIL